MSHMVIFQSPDGNPGYNQFESLEEAVRFVETLRNEQNVETARMFALEEVKFEFKPYFRVEIDPPAVGPGTTDEPVQAVTAEEPEPASEPAPAFSAPAFSTPEPAPAPDLETPLAPVFPEPEPEPEATPEPATAGAAPPPPTFLTVPTGSDDDEGDKETTRRGLFGR